jgi:hypothetical protein
VWQLSSHVVCCRQLLYRVAGGPNQLIMLDKKEEEIISRHPGIELIELDRLNLSVGMFSVALTIVLWCLSALHVNLGNSDSTKIRNYN